MSERKPRYMLKRVIHVVLWCVHAFITILAAARRDAGWPPILVAWQDHQLAERG